MEPTKSERWRQQERVTAIPHNTEQWFANPSVESLLQRVLQVEMDRDDRLNERLLRLFAVAVCRFSWDVLSPECRAAIEANELYADGLIDEDELHEKAEAATEPYEGVQLPGERDRDPKRRRAYAIQILAIAVGEVSVADNEGGWPYQSRFQPFDALECRLYERLGLDAEAAEDELCDRLRDIYGNPYVKVECDDAWKSAEVISLAERIYEESRFELMPQLGAALAAAGCENKMFLDHCQSKQTHVRGCWVLDILLDKRPPGSWSPERTKPRFNPDFVKPLEPAEQADDTTSYLINNWAQIVVPNELNVYRARQNGDAIEVGWGINADPTGFLTPECSINFYLYPQNEMSPHARLERDLQYTGELLQRGEFDTQKGILFRHTKESDFRNQLGLYGELAGRGWTMYVNIGDPEKNEEKVWRLARIAATSLEVNNKQD